MAISYPRSQTFIIALVCMATVAGALLYMRQPQPSRKSAAVTALAPTLEKTYVYEASATSDDWKKQFFKAESDTVASKKTAVVAKTTEPLTLTDTMGRNFFTSYIQLKQGNLTGNQEVVQNAVDYAIRNTVTAAAQPRFYTLQDLRVSADDSPATVHAYGNAVASAFALYVPRTDPANIAIDAFEKGDMSVLSGIDPIITGYARAIAALIAISVPSSLGESHLDLINGLSSVRYVAQGLRNSDKDPMQAMVALGTYGAALSSLQGALKDLKRYFDAKSIAFAAGESGASFATISTISP